jgi:protein-S-isoprenylcysteine O-methyltransferase Ste14
VRPLGIAVAVVGGALALRSALLLAGHGRPRRGAQPRFVLAGPYLRMRNPLYAGVLTSLAGLAVALRSWPLAVAAAAAAGLAHVCLVAVEEPRLVARFGAAYAEYLRRVPRWLPSRRPPADPIMP